MLVEFAILIKSTDVHIFGVYIFNYRGNFTVLDYI